MRIYVASVDGVSIIDAESIDPRGEDRLLITISGECATVNRRLVFYEETAASNYSTRLRRDARAETILGRNF